MEIIDNTHKKFKPQWTIVRNVDEYGTEDRLDVVLPNEKVEENITWIGGVPFMRVYYDIKGDPKHPNIVMGLINLNKVLEIRPYVEIDEEETEDEEEIDDEDEDEDE